MAYGDTLLGADHQWSFNNVLTDGVGSLTVTNSGGTFVTTPITRDSTHSYQTNGRDDLATVAPDATTGTAGFNRFAFQGWFMASQIQGPPCLIFKTGGNTAGFALFLWGGNNVMLQVKDVNANNNIQVFSDIALTDNRPYHFFVRYSGSGFSNEIEFYIDGVKQLANKDGVIPGAASMTAYTGAITWGENGTTSIDVSVGNEAVLVKAPVNGFWSQWWTWEGADSESITQTQIDDDLFGAGAIPDVTISADTEINMQTALDVIASTVRPDVPLCILVEEVTGGGDLNLTADNITFDPRASIHVRYEGSGTLNWTNSNGANADRSSGNVTFLNPSQLTLNNLDNPTEVRVYEAGTQNEVAGQESVTTGTFSNTISVPTIDIRLLSLSQEILKFSSVDMSNDTTIDVQQFIDRQYDNPGGAFTPQRLLINFGWDSVTTTPDVNGRYWNNFLSNSGNNTAGIAGSRFENLITEDNVATTIDFEIIDPMDGDFGTGQGSNNNGGFNGDVGIYVSPVAFDSWFAWISDANGGHYRFEGMDTERTYSFRFWGNREATAPRQIEIADNPSFTNSQIYESAFNQDYNTGFALFSGITGVTQQDFYLRVPTGTFGYISVMEITVT